MACATDDGTGLSVFALRGVMSPPARLYALLGLALALAIVLAYRLLVMPPRRGEALAYTECPFRGGARVTLTPGISPADTFPVRMHEEVHATQCRELGPWRYRLKNFTARGRLSLEAPAYCAGARARVRQGQDPRAVGERLSDDAQAAFAGLKDTMAVRNALRHSCPDVAR